MVQRSLVKFVDIVEEPVKGPVKDPVKEIIKESVNKKPKSKYRPKDQRMNKLEKYIWKNLLG